ncbi:MAG: hypothetical protein QM784_25870 [Polyangiaceae bacterium]
MGRKLSEVPVGFKWFVDGLIDGSYGFGGEESAGASFLRLDGTTWTTDKDGILLDSPRGRNHREDRQGSRGALPRPHRPTWRAGVRAHRRAGDSGAEIRAQEARTRERHGEHLGRGRYHSGHDPRTGK